MRSTLRQVTVQDIQVAIKRRLETIEGLHPSATEPPKPHLPAAYPRLVSWTYDTSMDAGFEWQFDVWVLVGTEPGEARAQEHINLYLSASGRQSLKEALEEDPTLGDTVDYARVTGGGNYGFVTVEGGVRLLGASVRLEVVT